MSEKIGGLGPTSKVFRLYYGFQFFFSLLPWLPIFYDYQRKMGLGDEQIFGIQSIYYIVFCVLELPTGYFADRFGYRLSMKAAAITLVIADLLPIFTPSYLGFFWHFSLVALARSFYSGASSAYLYDFLAERGKVSEYKRIEGNARAYGLIGKVVCWAGVGALMEWHLSLPYWLTVLAAALSALYAWALPDLRAGKLTQKVESERLMARMSGLGRILKGSPIILLIVFQGVAIFCLERVVQVNLFQPVLGQKGFGVTAYGLIMSVMTVFEAMGSAWASQMRRYVNDLNAVSVLSVMMAGCCVWLAFGAPWGAVAAFSLFAFLAGLSFPVRRQLMNDAIPDSRYRATLLSVESLIDRAVCAWVAAWMGSFVAGGRIGEFLNLSAAVTSASIGIVFLLLRRRRFALARA